MKDGKERRELKIVPNETANGKRTGRKRENWTAGREGEKRDRKDEKEKEEL